MAFLCVLWRSAKIAWSFEGLDPIELIWLESRKKILAHFFYHEWFFLSGHKTLSVSSDLNNYIKKKFWLRNEILFFSLKKSTTTAIQGQLSCCVKDCTSLETVFLLLYNIISIMNRLWVMNFFPKPFEKYIFLKLQI